MSVFARVASALFLLVIGALVGSFLQYQSTQHTEPAATDPRLGSVFVGDDGSANTRKQCDGLNLIYRVKTAQSVSSSVVPNSPECTR